jgi:hypothetical protein
VTTPAQIRANQANAKASTGPKTSAGARRSSANALRHGLSRPIDLDPALMAWVEALAREIAGADANNEIWDLAHLIAEAQVDLQRVRLARCRLLSDKANDPYYESPAATRQNVRLLSSLLSSKAHNMPLAAIEPFMNWMSKGPEKDALVLLQEVRSLSALDRYERRALSRRKFAIRALDEARGRVATRKQPS